MSKRLIPVVVFIFGLIPSVTMALGLGPITMRSALNQPLLAEIDIHSVQKGDLDGLAVRLASEEDFKRVNVERPSYLNLIKFQLIVRRDGSAFIKLTTDQPVTEPYLDFLIEARWPRGRALKEYTVLVDPPVLATEAPAPVEQPTTTPVFTPPEPKPVQQPRQAARPVPAQQPQAVQPKRITQEPKPVPRQVVSAPEPGSMDYGVVKRGDTLWEIAEELRQRSGTDATIHQIMMALLRANPDAFVNNNVNQLKAGQVLRLENEAVAQVTHTDSLREFRRQYREWKATKGRLVQQVEVASGDVEEQVEPSAGETRLSKAEQAKLKLVAPGKEGQGGAKDRGEAQQLRDDLILATEALDASRQESEELGTRLTELEEQLESMERLIMLKDEELLAFQNQVKEKAETEAAKPEVKPEPKPEQVKPKPTPVVEEEPTPSFFLSDYLVIGVALLALIGVVAWLVIRRRRMQEGFEESILNVGMGAAAAGAASGIPSQMVSGGGAESSMVSDFAMSDMGGIQSDAAEVDPISEADVYLAYGRHQQAEDIIKQALETNPERLELHAKLLEVLHAAGNRAGFEEHAQVLHDRIGGDESNEYWQRVAGLGSELCPDNPLFGGTLTPSSTAPTEFAGGMDEVTTNEEDLLDFDFNEDEIAGLESADSAVGAEEDNSLDFDVTSLDFNLDSDQEDKTAAVEDNSLDFDMPIMEEPAMEAETAAPSLTLDEEPTELNLTLDSDNEVDLDSLDFETESVTEAPTETLEEVPTELIEKPAEMDLSLDFDSEETLHAAPSDDMDIGFAEEDTSGFGGSELSLEDLGEDEELSDDIFADVDEIGTKLDLAKAYVDMGDSDGARSILDEVMEEGDDTQKEQAQELLRQIG